MSCQMCDKRLALVLLNISEVTFRRSGLRAITMADRRGDRGRRFVPGCRSAAVGSAPSSHFLLDVEARLAIACPASLVHSVSH